MILTPDDLSEPERCLWQAASAGTLVDLQPDQPDADVAQRASWSDRYAIRAELLVELLTDAKTPPGTPRARAVKLRGARITGPLDLRAATLICPLELRHCYFEEPVSLQQAQAPAIRLSGCHVSKLAAAELETRDSLVLNEGFTATGEVSLAGARVGGQLYCDNARLHNPDGQALFADGLTVRLNMLCRGLASEGVVRLPDARIGMTVEFDGATLVNPSGKALSADRLRVGGSLYCRHGFTAKGEMRLPGARIDGEVSFEGATLSCPDGWALTADGLGVGGSMYCGEGLEPSEEPFAADGEVALAAAHIAGQLSLRGARLDNPKGRALSADELVVDRGMDCTRCTAHGEVRLYDARVGGTLYFTAATLAGPGKPAGEALSADRLTVEGSMFCADGFHAQGRLSLGGAHIGRQLVLDGACLESADGSALSAASLTVGQDMTCGVSGNDEKFTANGGISLVGARIGGDLRFIGAKLTHPGRDKLALLADGITIEQNMWFGNGSTANGEVALVGARIGGRLAFWDVTLDNQGGRALSGDGVIVERVLDCGKGFTAKGEVRLPRARISEHLAFEGASLDNGNKKALYLQDLSAPTLYLTFGYPPVGEVDLVGAHVRFLVDEQDSWPAAVRLRGFTYDSIHTKKDKEDVGVRARLGWLKRDSDGFVPQPYEQLAAAYRREGDEQAARRVAVAKQWRRRQSLNPWNWLLYATVGYGYRTWLAGLWLLALLLVGTWMFNSAYPAGMLPAKSPPLAFHPLIYTADLLLPIVDLGEQSAWRPQGEALIWSWVLIAAGWLLTTAAVAGLAGVFKRD
jgi:hypothetical protein